MKSSALLLTLALGLFVTACTEDNKEVATQEVSEPVSDIAVVAAEGAEDVEATEPKPVNPHRIESQADEMGIDKQKRKQMKVDQ